jgi:[lysine-biosynthesis-protein LysW]--L-2-aminoadipate ligase
MATRIGMVYSRLRPEEKMLLEAAERRGVTVEPLHDDGLVLDVHQSPAVADAGGSKRPFACDAVLERSLSYYRSLYILRFLRAHGIPAVNSYEVAATCGDKTETSLRLARAGVPTPATRVAFTSEAALQALAEIGYPAVIKPTMGSWARLLARVDSPREAEAILEHKEALPNPLQHVFYIQAYVDKTDGSDEHKDIRAFVVGGRTIAAIWRVSPHWITNTARGGKAQNCPVTPELDELCARASEAVGGGVLALDIMVDREGRYLVHEVNHTMEFRNSVAPTGVDIPGEVVAYTIAAARA